MTKFKFTNRCVVMGKGLTDFHKAKGFKDNEKVTVYQVGHSETENFRNWGFWAKSSKGPEIRLQDLDGKLTGHGHYFTVLE
jgi:hypothetical protein